MASAVSAPAQRTFTKCLTPVAAYLHLQGATTFPYIDNWLIVSSSYEGSLKDTLLTLNTSVKVRLIGRMEGNSTDKGCHPSGIGGIFGVEGGWKYESMHLEGISL